MSNSFTAHVNLTQDPEDLELGGREIVKLRCADNTHGKNAETRFFDALVSGPDVEAARRLRKGDGLVVTGQLVASSYRSKKGKSKGQDIKTDSMPFGKIMQITKSPTFFNKDEAADESGTSQTEAPDLGGDDGADDPLADLGL